MAEDGLTPVQPRDDFPGSRFTGTIGQIVVRLVAMRCTDKAGSRRCRFEMRSAARFEAAYHAPSARRISVTSWVSIASQVSIHSASLSSTAVNSHSILRWQASGPAGVTRT